MPPYRGQDRRSGPWINWKDIEDACSAWLRAMRWERPWNSDRRAAAVYGQLAGAFYGESGIPGSWIRKVAMRNKIISFAGELYAFSRETRGM